MYALAYKKLKKQVEKDKSTSHMDRLERRTGPFFSISDKLNRPKR